MQYATLQLWATQQYHQTVNVIFSNWSHCVEGSQCHTTEISITIKWVQIVTRVFVCHQQLVSVDQWLYTALSVVWTHCSRSNWLTACDFNSQELLWKLRDSYSQVYWSLLLAAVNRTPCDCRERERERDLDSGDQSCVNIFLVMCWSHALVCFYVEVTANQSKQVLSRVNWHVNHHPEFQELIFNYLKINIMFQYWPKLIYHSTVLDPLQSCVNNLIQIVATCLNCLVIFSPSDWRLSLLITTGRMTSPVVCYCKTWDDHGVGWGYECLNWWGGRVSLAGVFWEVKRNMLMWIWRHDSL